MMKAEIQTRHEGNLYSQEAVLVSIDIDNRNTVTLTALGLEREEFDEDGNRTSYKWIPMDRLLKALDNRDI